MPERASLSTSQASPRGLRAHEADALDALVARIVAARVAEELRARREAWRLEAQRRAGGPSGHDVMMAALGAIERAGNEGQTVVGAHKAVRLACTTLGVPGSEMTRPYRRSRAQVDAAPNPGRPREGGGRAIRSGQG